MVAKRAENVIEIRIYIKGRSLLGLKPLDIHSVVCDYYGQGRICLFVGGLLNLSRETNS